MKTCVGLITFTMNRCCAFSFKTPSSIMIVGPSGSGKTVFTSALLTENLDLFETVPRKIVYCYSIWQQGYEKMKKAGVKFHEGIPDTENLPKWFPKGGILVLDDLMEEAGNDKRVLDLFTKDSHHQNITVIYLSQDMFPPGRFAKSISRNAHYIIAFKNPRDQVGLRNVLLQAYPTDWKKVQEANKKMTEKPFGYMVMDLHPRTADNSRILSNLLKNEGCIRCYQFNDGASK